MGGTESSIIKTAQILSVHYNIVVVQKFREQEYKEHATLKFIPKSQINKTKPDYLIVLRKYPLLNNLKKQFPKAKLFLWIHTYKNIEYAFKRFGLANTSTTIICNSKTHKDDTYRLLNHTFLGRLFSWFKPVAAVKYCYNPIDNPKPSQQKRDINKLLFFSSPNKGLKQIIECFIKINIYLPEIKLYIANPGYKENTNINLNAKIVILGSLAHKEMMKHVGNSLCVFYPQDSFSETFGLIYAEANAYGTVVLGHDIGSAREILHANNTLIDANNNLQIIETIKKWRKKYPKVEYSEDFSDETILSQWKELLQ